MYIIYSFSYEQMLTVKKKRLIELQVSFKSVVAILAVTKLSTETPGFVILLEDKLYPLIYFFYNS